MIFLQITKAKKEPVERATKAQVRCSQGRSPTVLGNAGETRMRPSTPSARHKPERVSVPTTARMGPRGPAPHAALSEQPACQGARLPFGRTGRVATEPVALTPPPPSPRTEGRHEGDTGTGRVAQSRKPVCW